MFFNKAVQNGSGKKRILGHMALVSMVLALVLIVCCVPVKSSAAYFTAVTSATGGITINYSDEDEFHEEVEGLVKTLTVKYGASGATIFARVKAVGPISISYSIKGDNWRDGGDGYWYYDLPLEYGESTSPLTVNIIPGDFNQEFEVVMAEEFCYAGFLPDGTPYATWQGGNS